LSYGRLSWSG